MQSIQRTTRERERDSERKELSQQPRERMKFLFSKRDIIFVMRFEEKNSKNGGSLLFRVINPIEAQKHSARKNF